MTWLSRWLGLWLTFAPLAAQATCRLDGQLLDPLQQPLAGATVTAMHGGQAVASTRSDAAGLFVFEALPQGRVCIQATTAAPDIAATDIDLLYETTRFTFLYAMPARVVRGVVKNTQGVPIAGAFVGAVPDAAGKLGPVACTAMSGADGAFVLGHVPFGACLLRAFAPEYATYADTLSGTGDLQLAIDLDERAAQTWTFPLRDGGFAHGPATITVTACRGDQPLPLPPLWLEPPLIDGAWQLAAVPSGDRLDVLLTPTLAADPQRYSLASGMRRHGFGFDLRTHDDAVLQLKFVGMFGTRPVRVLLQELGVPCPARLVLDVAANGTLTAPALVQSGDSFAVRLLDEEFVVHTDDASAWFTANHKAGCVHTVMCWPALTLKLRATDTDGAACPGTTVTLRNRNHNGITTEVGFGTTCRDGSEVLRGLHPANRGLRLELRSPRGWCDQPIRRDLHIDLGTVTLQKGCELLVRTTTADGKPAPGGRITVRTADRSTHAGVADRDGRLLLTGLVPWNGHRRDARSAPDPLGEPRSLAPFELSPLGGDKVVTLTWQGTERLEATVIVE